MCPCSRGIALGLSESQKWFLKMKMLQSACLLRLPKDDPSVMSLSVVSGFIQRKITLQHRDDELCCRNTAQWFIPVYLAHY